MGGGGTCVCHSIKVKVKGQLAEVCSLSVSCGFWNQTLISSVSCKCSLPTLPSHWPRVALSRLGNCGTFRRR